MRQIFFKFFFSLDTELVSHNPLPIDPGGIRGGKGDGGYSIEVVRRRLGNGKQDLRMMHSPQQQQQLQRGNSREKKPRRPPPNTLSPQSLTMDPQQQCRSSGSPLSK